MNHQERIDKALEDIRAVYGEDIGPEEAYRLARNNVMAVMNNEIVIPLPSGGSMRCGPGEEHEYGGYVRLCDENGDEVEGCYWDKAEWQESPESVMGAIFGSTKHIVQTKTFNNRYREGR